MATIDKEIVTNSGKKYMLTKDYLGGGAFGSVFLALDENGKKYALKTIIDVNGNMDFFINEMNILYNYSKYPNCNRYIVCIYDHLLQGKVLQIVMEYVEGKTLTTVDFDDDIFIQCIEGLKAISSKKIVHRDIKPDNIILDTKNKIKYVDFGVGCSITEINDNPNIIKKCKGSPGTESFLDPMFFSSQINSACEYSDIYALGITFCVMLGLSAPKYRLRNPNSFQDIYNGFKEKISTISFVTEKIKNIIKSMVNPFLPRPTTEDILNYYYGRTDKLNLSYKNLNCLESVKEIINVEEDISEDILIERIRTEADELKNDILDLGLDLDSDKTYLKMAVNRVNIPDSKKKSIFKKLGL